MCGIVGFTGIIDTDLLKKMNNLLFHRGPDDSGEFIDKENNVCFAMRRLNVIDLEKGKQPMANEDESIWVIYNGEIYNSPELRLKLLSKGHIFKTNNSDTEVLLHLYEEKKSDLLFDLNGMFAFVIYDKKKKMLFGARDRIGIKPFYYSFKNSFFAFASELKSLLLLPWISKDIDFQSLYHYISLQFIPAPNSIFIDINKLPGGHFFIYDLKEKKLTIKKYWELNVTNIIEERSIEEWIDVVKKKLKESVKRWTLSDVPIACSLSGGLDSSSLVGFLVTEGINNLRTYSLGFAKPQEQDYNELNLARKVAQKWHTEHYEVILEPEKVLYDLEKMVWHLDEPYGGGLPSWYIYKIVGRDVKVCLTGTGGDELFGNYGKYRIYEKPKWYRFLKAVRDAIRHQVFKEIKDSFNYPIGYFYPRYFSDAVKDAIVFDRKVNISMRTEAYIENIWKNAKTNNTRNAVAYIDFKLQLPEEFLLVTDRFSMAHSVEARVPFLDHTLVELVYNIPPLIRTGWNRPKSFFLRIVEDLLPQEILNAPKRGFVLPLDIWTRKELKPKIKNLLSPEYLKKQGIFSTKVYERIVKPHLSGKVDFTQQVWTLFMFQMWYEKFLKNGEFSRNNLD